MRAGNQKKKKSRTSIKCIRDKKGGIKQPLCRATTNFLPCLCLFSSPTPYKSEPAHRLGTHIDIDISPIQPTKTSFSPSYRTPIQPLGSSTSPVQHYMCMSSCMDFLNNLLVIYWERKSDFWKRRKKREASKLKKTPPRTPALFSPSAFQSPVPNPNFLNSWFPDRHKSQGAGQSGTKKQQKKVGG